MLRSLFFLVCAAAYSVQCVVVYRVGTDPCTDLSHTQRMARFCQQGVLQSGQHLFDSHPHTKQGTISLFGSCQWNGHLWCRPRPFPRRFQSQNCRTCETMNNQQTYLTNRSQSRNAEIILNSEFLDKIWQKAHRLYSHMFTFDTFQYFSDFHYDHEPASEICSHLMDQFRPCSEPPFSMRKLKLLRLLLLSGLTFPQVLPLRLCSPPAAGIQWHLVANVVKFTIF